MTWEQKLFSEYIKQMGLSIENVPSESYDNEYKIKDEENRKEGSWT